MACWPSLAQEEKHRGWPLPTTFRRLRSAGTRIKTRSLFVPSSWSGCARTSGLATSATLVTAWVDTCQTPHHTRGKWMPRSKSKHSRFGILVPEFKAEAACESLLYEIKKKEKKEQGSYLPDCVMSWAEKRVIRGRPHAACMRCSCAQCYHTARPTSPSP